MIGSVPVLLLLIALPLVGALSIALCPARWVRHWMLAFAATVLLYSLGLVFAFNPDQPGFQFVHTRPWIDTLNIHLQVGVDGLSVLFLPMVSLLSLSVLFLARNAVDNLRLYAVLVLLLEGATLGIFTALDTILFFLFWELSLPPLFFLISLFGIGPDRRAAAMKYTLYMLFGGAPLLFAFMLLAWRDFSTTSLRSASVKP